MLKYLNQYVTSYEKELNTDLMTKKHDKPLVDFVIDSWKSLQIMEGIEILKYEYSEKESEIDINKYIFKRERGLRKTEKYDYKYIDDSRLGLLTVWVRLRIENYDAKSGGMVANEQVIKKSMLIPLQDENGLYHINGKDIYMVYQLLEKSTYTASNSVILKSLMPFAVRRYIIDAEDMEGNQYKLPYYTIELFRKDVEIMLIYATRGLNSAIQFALDSAYLVMEFVDTYDPDDLTNLYFQISNKLYIKVNRVLFEQYVYVRSVVGGILQISTNRLTLAKIDDPEIWLKKLGNNNVQKGQNLLASTKRLLDETTGKILRLDIYNKHDVLSLVRWMTEEYNDLRMKDNMDLSNKRIRSNEIINALLTFDWSLRLNRIMSLGKKATIDNYRELFSFPGDIIIQKIQSAGIQRYNDVINDMDFFSKYKYTIKGPNSLGNKNANNIGVRYRGLHHSFIGHIDLTVCGNSDPGTSGLLTPCGKMDGLYFDDKMEPDDFLFDFKKSIEEIVEQKGVDYITIDFETKEDFYKAANALRAFNNECIKVTSTSIEDDTRLVIQQDIDMDDRGSWKMTDNGRNSKKKEKEEKAE